MVIVDETNEDEEMLRAVAASMESIKDSSGVAAKDKDETVAGEEETFSTKKPTYPPLPEEPKGDRNLLCRVGFRLPDGRRVQRNFFRTDPVQVMLHYSFYYPVLQINWSASSVFNLLDGPPLQ
jgi:hypothetical protein